jgi:serine/threonine protein kinase
LLPEEWERAKALYAEARKLNPSEREGFLRQAGESNGAVLQEVASLLMAESQVGSFLETQALEIRGGGEFADAEAPLAENFSGTDRFLLKKLLGYGGFGVVYEAYDRRREMPVALKCVRRSDPSLLYLIKREFRSLVDVAHPNLVKLYELFSEGSTYFFTMELLAGVDFVCYLREGGSRSHFNLPRLREALTQLVEGVEALHRLGKLHRDIKPGNVMVTSEGRVVLLDFGLVKELSAESFQQSLIGGTPNYMSPEQFERRALTSATDWYAVGVMLYEVLTGKHPFSGDMIDIMHQKRKDDLVPPAQLTTDIPPELDRLCCNLLSREPEQRPDGRTILRTLDLAGEIALHGNPAPLPALANVVVGRESHIAMLMDQFRLTLDGQAVIVNVCGPSGMGKTTLLQAFSHRLHETVPEALVLSGRCHESEAVPFKALDSFIDDLSRYLGLLPDSVRDAVVPRDFHFLERLFPVLGRVGAPISSSPKPIEVGDSKEVRKRAFHALLELFCRVVERRPLVLVVDDLQWGDLDSAAFFDYLLRASSPPGLLLIASYRSEEINDSPFLRAYRFQLNSTERSVVVSDLEVGELSLSETRQLLEQLVPQDAVPLASQSEIIVRETGGSPFLITQFAYLGRDSSVAREERDGGEIGRQPLPELSGIITRRAASLPVAARRLLEAVSVAGQPILEAVAMRAAELPHLDDRAVTLLISEKFIKTGGERRIEAYHDKIRESVSASLAEPVRRSLHKRIAEALQLHEPVDCGVVAAHFQQAGERDQAAEFALKAAETARRALAFDQEAYFYRLTLRLRGEDGAEAAVLRRKLGDALVNAGRGVEAAGTYADAARGAGSAAERTQLGLRSAEEYLRGGLIDQGISSLRAVAVSAGVRLSENVAQTLLVLAAKRAQLWLRGLRFRERRPEEIPDQLLLRLDVYWSLTIGLGFVNSFLGAAFHAKHLLLALRAGEPDRIAMSLAFEGAFAGFRGERHATRAYRVFHTARELALRSGNPRVLGFCDLMEATWSLLTGRFRSARELSESAESMFRERCTGAFWELAVSNHQKA